MSIATEAVRQADALGWRKRAPTRFWLFWPAKNPEVKT
jgi:hypothetical protein